MMEGPQFLLEYFNLKMKLHTLCIKGHRDHQTNEMPYLISFVFQFTVGKLLELHGEGSGGKGGTTTTTDESGEKVARPDNYEPPVLESV